MEILEQGNNTDQGSGSAIIPTRNVRRATGPRTELGKRTASRNATKYGIFSKVVLLKHESSADYRKLLTGLREALQPEGALEDLLVETLATTAWRKRRLLLAEGAQIRMNTEFLVWDRVARRVKETSEQTSSLAGTIGIIRFKDNPDVVRYCIDSLKILQNQIEESGFKFETNTDILKKLYGPRQEAPLVADLYELYLMCFHVSNVPEEERVREGYGSPEQSKDAMLRKIKDEIRRLRFLEKENASVETKRMELEFESRNVPDALSLERLLRYEASLERAFDRALSQLERLQRIRHGQSVPPPINVNISGMSS
jgi:hypothetical protein